MKTKVLMMYLFTVMEKEIIIAMNSGDIVIVISAATSEQDFDDMSEYESAEQEEEYVD